MQNLFQALVKLYPTVDPVSKSNTKMPQRLRNKLVYAANFTRVEVYWQSVAHPVPDIIDGPTYNPYLHPSPRVPVWKPNEVGFRDPVTVVVRHEFALLPGIGRILATPVQIDQHAGPQPSGSQATGVDLTANRITRQPIDNLYTIQLEGSATFVNEGFKSRLRYAIQP